MASVTQNLGWMDGTEQKTDRQNFNPAFEKIKRKFNLWLLRDLSLRGRVLLSKAEGISRLTYIASTIHLDNKTVNTIDQTLFKFLWKNRVHYIRKSVCCKFS